MAINASDSRKRRGRVWIFSFAAALVVAINVSPWGSLSGLRCQSASAYAMQSDLNHDRVVDIDDVIIFSSKYLKQDWQVVDWCTWLEQDDKYTQKQQLTDLINFIAVYFQCPQTPTDPLAIKNQLLYPTRLTYGPGGQLYVSDAKVGSVFIYDTSFNLIGELKDLNIPLGVAVDSLGNLYVGSDGRDIVEVYDSTGNRVRVIGSGADGAGTIDMPNDLALGQGGDLYVADSRANEVLKFDATNGAPLGTIGVGQLRFPTALAIAGSELYVADQGNHLVRVFDLQGNLLRSLGGNIGQGMMGYKWQGRFVRLQSVAVDGQGRVHALDSHMCVIQVLDPQTGAYLTSYGTEGADPGQLRLPLDMVMNSAGELIVTDAGNRRVEVFSTTP